MMNASSSLMLLASLGIHLIVLKTGDCSIVKNSWRPVPVSNASLQDSSVKTEEINSVSDMTCSILATKSRWANLFCYKSGLCSLFDLLAVPSWNDSLITDPVNCMTKITGCVLNQKIYPEYEPVIVNGLLPNECSICLTGNQFANVEFISPNKIFPACEEPFKQTSFGCLGLFFDPVDYCTAVKKCILLGGTLANSLEMLTSKDQLPAFADELASTGDNQYFYTGIKKNAPANEYIFTESRNYLTDQSGLWYAGFPTLSRFACVAANFQSNRGLKDVKCHIVRNYICKRKIKG